MKTVFRILFSLFLIMGTVELLNAQVPGGGGPPSGGSPSCWPPPCIPIDGGVGLLMAAGIAFGAKKLFDLRK